MAYLWHICGMSRVRVSTTVDGELLERARSLQSEGGDSALIDAALGALVQRYEAAEIDASYAKYDEQPFNEPDEWGDLASFSDAAGAT